MTKNNAIKQFSCEFERFFKKHETIAHLQQNDRESGYEKEFYAGQRKAYENAKIAIGKYCKQ
jgi:hypothetical protein